VSRISSRHRAPRSRAEPQQEPFQPAREDPLLQRAVPVTRDVSRYRAPAARRDLVAGLTVAALAVPSGMAYAELAGVTAIYGLYSLLAPCVAYTLLGSSRQVIIGPSGSLALMVAAAIAPLATLHSPEAAGLAAMLALIAGGWFLLAWALRIGWIADYLSRGVLIGYMHGVVILVIVSQLGGLLGLSIHEHNVMPVLVETAREIGDANPATVLLSLALLAVLIPLAYKAPRIPAALIAMAAAILASRWLDLPEHGVAVVGDIPSGLPDVAVPHASLSDIAVLVPAAFGMFLVSFADETLIARTFAGRHRQSVRVNQELLAMGAASLASSVTHGITIAASESRTAVNDTMGARTQISGLWAVAAVVAVLMFLTGPLADLPKPVLGVVIIAAVLTIIDPKAWRFLWETDRVEVTIAAVTAAGVVVVGILPAVAFAVGLSIVDVVRRSARPHDAVLGWLEAESRWADVALHRDATVIPGVIVYHLDDRLFFANADYVKARVFEALRAAPTSTRCVIFDASSVTHVDTAGLDALADLARELADTGVELRVAAVKDHLTETFAASGTVALIGPEHFYPTVTVAAAATPVPAGR
jgi:SulP family sulfate permease